MVASKKTTAKKVVKKTTKPTKKKTAKIQAENKKKASITIDRRGKTDRRDSDDRRQKSEPVSVERRAVQRREKVCRRRQIDPTTCERDYNCDEIEFMSAMDQYKRTSGRMFPTCSEVLEVIKKLGYQKISDPQPEEQSDEQQEVSTEPSAMPAVEMPNVGISSPAMIG